MTNSSGIRQLQQAGSGTNGALPVGWFHPNLMIECYPNVSTISSFLPDGPEQCINVVEFYLPEEIGWFEGDSIEAERAAYIETAVEDRAVCELVQCSREALWQRGRNKAGPCHALYENGMQHSREFVQRQLRGC